MTPSYQAYRQRAQFPSMTRKNRVAVVQVRWDVRPTQSEALPSIRLPHVHASGTASNQKPISEVGIMLQNWHFLMPFTTSCVLSPARPINPNRARQPTISLHF